MNIIIEIRMNYPVVGNTYIDVVGMDIETFADVLRKISLVLLNKKSYKKLCRG